MTISAALAGIGIAAAALFVGTPAFAASPPTAPIVTPITDPTVVSGTTTPGSVVAVASFTAIPKVVVTADSSGHFTATLASALPTGAIVVVLALTPAADAESRTLVVYDGSTSAALPITPNVTLTDSMIFSTDSNSNGVADVGDTLTYTLNISYANDLVPGVLNPASGTDDSFGRLTQTVTPFTVNATQAAACGLPRISVALDSSNGEYAVSPGATVPTTGCGAALLPSVAGTPQGGSVNTHYMFDPTTTGPGPFTFATTGTLPPGLTIDPASGVVSGTPTAAGTFSFGVTATGPFGTTTTPFAITVTSALALTGVSVGGPLAAGFVALLVGFGLLWRSRRVLAAG